MLNKFYKKREILSDKIIKKILSKAINILYKVLPRRIEPNR